MQRYCFVLIFSALGFRNVADGTFTAEEGSFEAIVQNISSCVSEQPWFHANVTTYTSNGRRLLRGHVATQRQIKNVKFHIILSYVESSKVKAFEIKNQNCHNFLVGTVLRALKIRYDAKKCTMEPTTSDFKGLDLNNVIHSVVQSLWYGTVQIRWEIAVATGTVMCLDIDLQFIKV